MFEKCKNLIFVNISNFITNEKCTVDFMFSSCQKVLKDKIKKQNKNIKYIAFNNSFDIFSSELFEESVDCGLCFTTLIDFKEQEQEQEEDQEEDQIIFRQPPPTKNK